MAKELNIVKDLANICEFTYRKGVADAASSGDFMFALDIADRADDYTTFRFMHDQYGQNLSLPQYEDYICMISPNFKANNIKALLRYGKNSGPLRKSICIMVDFYYRKGLRDGVGVSKTDGVEFLEELKRTMNHNRLDGTRQSKKDWIEEIKYAANTVSNLQKSKNMRPSTNILSVYIGTAMKFSREYDE